MYGLIEGLSERIKQERNNINLSQKDLADKVGVHKSSVYAWEIKKAQPSLIILMKLSYIFNVSTDYLLGLEKEKRLNVGGLSDKEVGAFQDLIDGLKNKK